MNISSEHSKPNFAHLFLFGMSTDVKFRLTRQNEQEMKNNVHGKRNLSWNVYYLS